MYYNTTLSGCKMKKLAAIFIILIILPATLNAQQLFTDKTNNLPPGAINGNTMDVAVADLDGDGDLDIVLAKEWQMNRILFNDGAGKFTDVSAGKLKNANFDSEDIAIADFDKNGWPDIVFACEDDSTQQLYMNTGYGNFVDSSHLLPHFISNAVATWDITGDGYPDLVFGNAGQDRVFINDGSGRFKDETSLRLPVDANITQDLLLVDLDNDSDMDIALGNEDGNKLLINNGSGMFTDETSTRLPLTVSTQTRKVSKGDVNGDGAADLFYSNMTSVPGNDIKDRLYLNDGAGFFTDVTNSHLPSEFSHTFDAVFTDINNDGSTDLLVAYMGNNMPGIFINDGTGKFADYSFDYLPASAAGNNIAILAADFNGDSKKDIYIGSIQQNDKLLLHGTTAGVTGPVVNTTNVYPNPANENITIALNNTQAKTEVQLLTLTGIAVKTCYGTGSIVLPVSSVLPGHYIVAVKSGETILHYPVTIGH